MGVPKHFVSFSSIWREEKAKNVKVEVRQKKATEWPF
jgi:hypothetical protein